MNDASSGPVNGAVLRLDGRSDDLRDRWSRLGGTPSVLAELVKAELRRRFSEGQRPAVADFLEVLPELRADSDRMLSLIYEEFCLREEAGEAPSPDSFCDRYAPWRDSLASQLNYHRMLSQAAGVLPGPPTRFPEPGEHFLRFRLRSVLGQGGAARVFLADDQDLGNRLSALKVSPDRGEEPSIMGRLDHPHIIPVLNVVRDPESGLRGLCMPYRPGRPLDQVIRRMENIPVQQRTARTLLEAAAPEDLATRPDGPGWGKFPRRGSYADACAWLVAILADALAHAHGREILHRDVKPANVLLSAVDGPQLLDFNLAHDPHAPERAESALRGGTLPYMAPEQLEAFLDPDRWDLVGPTADHYALGLVLRELLTGQRPEAPAAEVPLPRAINELLAMRINGWPPVRATNPAVPHALGAILDRCIAPDPAKRYPSAVAFAGDLNAFLRRRPLIHATNPCRRERVRNWFYRHRVVLSASALLVIAPSAWYLTTRDTIQDVPRIVDRARLSHFQAELPTIDHDEKAELLASAREDYSRALKLDPSCYEAFCGLGLVAKLEEDPRRAIEVITDAIQLAEQDNEIFPQTLAQFYIYRVEIVFTRSLPGTPEEPGSRLDSRTLEGVRADLDRARHLLPEPEGSEVSWVPGRGSREAVLNKSRAELELWSGRERMARAVLNSKAIDPASLRDARSHLKNALEYEVLDPMKSYGAKKLLKQIDRLIGPEDEVVVSRADAS